MARVKGAMNARKKHKKVLKLAKGLLRGSRSKLYRPANTFRNESIKKCIYRKKIKEKRLQKTLDTKNKC